MPRRGGLSARLKLTFSYAGFLALAGALLLAVVWVFLLRYVPDGYIESPNKFVPNRSDLLKAFAPRALHAWLFLLGFGLIGGWFLAGRMLSPLAEINRAARLAGQGSLSHRIRMRGKQDEFTELADVFDTMLDQLESQVEEQRRFAANASHELRTPLAITQTLLEVASKDPTRDVDELIARLQGVNSRAIQLADALLLLNRTSGELESVTRVDLSLLAEEAAENLLPLAERRGVSLEVTADPAVTTGSEAFLLQMITNLMHNALVHNLPERGVVMVQTRAGAGRAVIRVENSGLLLAEDVAAGLGKPFQRGQGRTRAADQDHAGSGLGLAIVHNIVAAHGGHLRFESRAGGGAVVTVELPGA